jgi:hypothetical protein
MSDYPVEQDQIFGCLLWQGKQNSNGYGVKWVAGKARDAHRYVYEIEVGPVPTGMVLDHECRRRLCVRHVVPVTKQENEFRKSWAYRCRIKQCSKGHSMSDAMVTPEGGRICRSCK